MKIHSSFFSERILSLIQHNIKVNPAAADSAARFIDSTSYWLEASYEELREMVFSPSLKRSWFVLSDGSCPSCGESVPMYNWIYDPINQPWKMKCPHCSGLFPKNDFKAYYDSGLDKKGIFKHELADRTLLESIDGTDFGVDDGNGWYDNEGRRYMFIGAYLCHAQWKGLVKAGAHRLAFSYVLSGNIEYARRAAVLLDAIADFWPEYDFYTQGLMYEQEFKSNGYVNYWVDSNRESRAFALAYDQVFEALKSDGGLAAILGKDFDVFSNHVENRILLDTLANIKKINTNPPETPQTVAIIKTVLNHDPAEMAEYIDELIRDATRVDGLSGESGLGGYAAISPRAIADLMCLYTNTDDNFIEKILNKHPQLYKTYRFHIDTWYDAKYYPGVGDSSVFALPYKKYTALFSHHAPLTSVYHRSREWFIMKLSRYYGDPDLAKTIYHSYDGTTAGCFDGDFYISNPQDYENELEDIIQSSGVAFNQKSINYNEWRISVLHSGSGDNKRMLAMPYDSGANHCHHDALSLHLFYKGINMTPDFGYPPVNYGGWRTKKARWYKHPSAHNLVVIDGKSHTNIPKDGDGLFYRYPEYGRNIMFASGSFVNATYNDSREYNASKRYERLTAMIDIDDSGSYVVDIARTDGGCRHAKFLRSTYSEIKTNGLALYPSKDYYPDATIMRNFQSDISPDPGWSIDFKAFADAGKTHLEKDIHMKYTGLTSGASVNVCESWVDITRMVQTSNIRTGNTAIWIPTIYEEMEGPRTQFTGVIELYENNSELDSIFLIETSSDSDFNAAIEVNHISGLTDYIIAKDPEGEKNIRITDYGIESDGLLVVVRMNGQSLIKATVCSGTYLTVGTNTYIPETNPEIIEFL